MAEFVIFMQAIQLTASVQVNTYTDSKYAITTIHIHGALYKERGVINMGGKCIKYGQEILKLLDTVWAPTMPRAPKGRCVNCPAKLES
jgi:hypothetical protein